MTRARRTIRLMLPDNLPVPQDDGAARHLTGMRLPDMELAATDGSRVKLAQLKGRTVVYVYPRTGRPGRRCRRLGRHPGRARLHAAILRLPRSFRRAKAARRRAAVSGCRPRTSPTSVRRWSGCTCRSRSCRTRRLKLTRALELPTFTVDGMTLIKRMAWVIDDGVDHARVLSGVSAGPERRRGDRLASGVAIEIARAPPRTPRGTFRA